MVAPFSIPSQVVWGFQFLHPYQHLLILLILAILIGVQWPLIVALICISDGGLWCWAYFPVFIGHCVYSLEKWLFRFFAQFLSEVICLFIIEFVAVT